MRLLSSLIKSSPDADHMRNYRRCRRGCLPRLESLESFFLEEIQL